MEYCNKAENQSRTLDTNPKAYRQAPISEVLQAYRNKTSGWRPDLYHTIQRASKFNNLSGIDPLPPVFQSSNDKFINVLKANNSLSFIITEPESIIALDNNVLKEDGTTEGDTDIYIREATTPYVHIGKNLDALADLLRRNTPKIIHIDINLYHDPLSNKSEAYIASVLAHEVGTHVQPYARILKKITQKNDLEPEEINDLGSAHGTEDNQIDHKRLHEGYLTMSCPSSLEKPSYRELISALCDTEFLGDADAVKELWLVYTNDVARYNPVTGEAGAPQTGKQLEFYRKYEQWAVRKGWYPYKEKWELSVKRHPVISLFILFCFVIAFLFYMLVSDGRKLKSSNSN